MAFHYSELSMPTEHVLLPEFPQPFMVKKEADYELRAGVLVDGGNRFGVSSVIFDKYEELIWMGNQGGHVTSYYGPQLQRYTSFQIHVCEEVRDILTLEEGIYCLTKTSLRHQIRRGLPRHTHKSPNMQDMQCLFQVDTHKVLMGGHQDKLLELDLNKWVEGVINVPEEGCAVLRSGGGSVVACGSANGMITLRDIRCLSSVEQSFRAHTACLSDLDMQGDMLITCGFTQSSSSPVAEPYVVVWDVRCLRGSSLRQIPTMSPPQLLHFVPAVSGRAVAMASDGHVTVLDVNDSLKPESQSVFQVETHSSQCSVMDVSSTSQALAFGDLGGHIHMFSAKHNHEPMYNSFSRPTEFGDPLPSLPRVSFKDETFSFSSIPRPPLTTGTKWLSDMPPEFYHKTYRKLKPVDPEILRTMKMQGPIGYAPNPKTVRRNQMPYIEETLQDVIVKPKETRTVVAEPIPKHYLKMDLRFKKPRSNDSNDSLNKVGFPGLEFTLPNSYCNSMLQVLYHIPAVKATLLAHTCAKEFCLSCELGFLFRMLDTSGGAPCQADNFLRAFRTVPEAAALGLILPDGVIDHRADLISLIQSWNRFMLQQIHSEILEARKKEKELTLLAHTKSPPKQINKQVNGYQYHYTELKYMGPPVCEDDAQDLFEGPMVNNHDGSIVSNHVQPEKNGLKNHISKSDDEESEISKLFAIGRHQVNRCTKCNKEEERESVVMACALQYVVSTEGGKGGFLELVRASLAARRSTPAWCEHCARFTPTVQRGRILRLPPILAINCGGATPHEKAYWTKGVQKDTPETTKRGSSSKPCRYGLHCARPGCRFKHPERPSSAPQMNSLNISSQESNCVLSHQMNIRLLSDGEVIIDDKTDSSPMEPRFDFSLPRKKPPNIQHEEEYSLSSVVLCVEDNPRNLVAYVRIPDEEDDCRWYLFNDLSIVPVSADEVVQFSSWWKSPCVLFYMNAQLTAGDS
ncbi:PAN2-PAN3 deadenylation complex catalytic subunit PAN2 [Bicyclus anynana]|uniref:PAN2-PAN3 deadenylation complex catalytic subunit PAN2 n=1 Tax=Bicyclus anynana TaxID=110368 RepID=A0A6J1NA96_BICAN|nr:PAN2-PAN3 deadenylation complex catalytic subunit PAN2 [Bicyclus anynana]